MWEVRGEKINARNKGNESAIDGMTNDNSVNEQKLRNNGPR